MDHLEGLGRWGILVWIHKNMWGISIFWWICVFVLKGCMYVWNEKWVLHIEKVVSNWIIFLKCINGQMLKTIKKENNQSDQVSRPVSMSTPQSKHRGWGRCPCVLGADTSTSHVSPTFHIRQPYKRIHCLFLLFFIQLF